MKQTFSLVFLAVLATGSIALGGNPKPKFGGMMAPSSSGDEDDPSPSASKLVSNPALLAEIDETLIRTNGCRSMAAIGYANGYQCPKGAAMNACMKMMKEDKVEACAEMTGRNYGAECNAPKEKNSAEERARSKCLDLSSDLWDSLAIRIPFQVAKKQLEAFGCKVETGTTMTCEGHRHDWLCKPLERGGVVTCHQLKPKAKKAVRNEDIR